MGIHKASKAEINDVLFRIPFNRYFSTWYIEMLIAVAYSLRYERLKNLEFSIKNTWLYEEEISKEIIETGLRAENLLDELYQLYLKYEWLQITSWEKIEEILRVYAGERKKEHI